jgi:predicted nucleotidyltransferase
MMAVLQAASRLAVDYIGAAGYALAYGSHATGRAHTDSDLDLLVVGAHPLTTSALDRLTGQVVALHHQHGLTVDTEVDHRVKLHASLHEVADSLALGGFTVDLSGNLQVPPVVAEPSFLNSHPFKLRLILNAVSTGHVFLAGNLTSYRRHRARADLALGLLTAALLADNDSFTVADALTALTRAPGGEVGEDHLGYLPGPALYSALRRALAEATLAQVITDENGHRFTQHHARRRTLLAALAARRGEPAPEAQHASLAGSRGHQPD